MVNIPDHPDIANAMRYGYPNAPEKHTCCKCGAEAQCYGITSGYKCFSCAREEFAELADEEAVEKLGFEII